MDKVDNAASSDETGESRLRRALDAGIVACLLTTTAIANADALPHVSKLAPDVLAQASRAAIVAVRSDVQAGEIAFALDEQAFAVAGTSRVLYLVPVSYPSRKALNGVCDLLGMDDHFRITGRARLFGADNQDEEVLARCRNVLAAAFRPRAGTHLLDGVYLLATGVVNTDRNAAEVVVIDIASGTVVADDKRTAAIDDGKEPQSVGPLMERLQRLR